MKFHGKYLIFLLFIFSVFSALKAQNLIVGVDPQSTTTEINETVSLNITIKNINNLGGFQFDVFYDTDIVQAKTATIGDLLASTGRTPLPLGPEINNNTNPGKITFGGASFGTGAGPSGGGVLAKIEFTALAAGNSVIDLQNVQVSDVNGQSLNVNSVNDGEVVVSGGSVTGIVVTNTNDSGQGSLRWALERADSQAGADTIIFNIPQIDANYNNTSGVWTIYPESPLPAILDSNLIIDGTSQKAFMGEDTNPDGPEIEIDGSNAGNNSNGLYIRAPGVEILELIINNFQGIGIMVSSIETGRISGCYIGVSYDGLAPASNGGAGIYLNCTRRFHISPSDTIPSIISGNKGYGIYMPGASNNLISGNIIGLNRTKTDTLGNAYNGIYLIDCDSNEVVDNFIGGNRSSDGIMILRGTRNTISHNSIGCNLEAPEINLGNAGCGIDVGISSDNYISGNTIAYNKVYGVRIYGDQSIHNTITRNFIFRNGWAGISNYNGGNNELPAPVLTHATLNSVTGTALPNSTVEIFADEQYQGAIFLGTVTADASGNFSWSGEEFPPEFFFTATATDAEGNTSEFSNAIKGSTDVEDATSPNSPEHFSLSQNYPNPFNPETKIEYQLPDASNVEISIFNMQGQKISTIIKNFQTAGTHKIKWQGNDENGNALASGVYLYQLKAGEFVTIKKMLLLR